MRRRRHHLTALAALALGLALALVLALVVFGGGGRLNVTFKVDSSTRPGKQPKTVTVPKEVVDEVGTPRDARGELAEPTKAIEKAVPGEIRDAERSAARIKARLPGLPTAGASISVPGCRTMFIRSFSSRHGVRPTQFWLHYTASPNVKGWADVLSIVHYFTTVEASSHFVLDREGNCAYIVPVEQKAWTQMAANPFGINFEIIDTGREATYLDAPGYAKLGSVLRYLSRLTGIPLRRGAVAGCSPTLSGVVTHWMGGLCSGGHVDLKPFDIDHEIRLLAGTAPRRPCERTKTCPRRLPPCTAKNLQRRLGVPADGVVGPVTRRAIANLQRRHGIRPTGRAGARVGRILGLAGCRL